MKSMRLLPILMALPAATMWGTEPEICAHTFSIVAADPETSEVGVAVATRLPAVGMYVPFAEAGVGAVASQAIVNPAYGPAALRMLRSGAKPEEIIRELTSHDPRAVDRQLTVINQDGQVAGFTGGKNSEVCGHILGDHFAVAGNLLATSTTLPALADTFRRAKGRLADRMLEALAAGEAAGGDRRGKQSAAILVVRPDAFFNGKVVDLRVDDSPDPIRELQRVYGVYTTAFLNIPGYRPLPEGTQGEDVRKLNNWLAAAGSGDRAALSAARDTMTSVTLAALERFLAQAGFDPAKGLTPEASHALQKQASREKQKR
jgi:uncharacterized Ntn-hydrolase superfamily protein